MSRVRLEVLAHMNLILDGHSQSILPGSVIDAPADMNFGSSMPPLNTSENVRQLTEDRAEKLGVSLEPAPEHPAFLHCPTSVKIRQP